MLNFILVGHALRLVELIILSRYLNQYFCCLSGDPNNCPSNANLIAITDSASTDSALEILLLIGLRLSKTVGAFDHVLKQFINTSKRLYYHR